MKKTLIFCTTLLVALFSCQKEQIIPADFETYVDAFFAEGKARGFEGNKSDFNIEIEFDDIDNFGLCANRSGKITIDRQRWANATEAAREWVIFHELGHCILDRDHRDNTSATGECLSFMRAKSTCSLNLYSDDWRTYYINELFNSDTNIPIELAAPISFDDIQKDSQIAYIDTFTNILNVNITKIKKESSYLLNMTFSNFADSIVSNHVYIGSIQYSFCHACTGPNAGIRLASGPNHTCYSNLNGEYKTDASSIKLSIYKEEPYMYFYANGTYLHGMESSLLEGFGVEFNRLDSVGFELEMLK